MKKMAGETNLEKLLATMRPEMRPGEFVFCCVDEFLSDAVMCFREAEGVTVILEKGRADELGLNYSYVAAWITLTVHSSLEAVGLTAAFSARLAEAGISCNVVAGYYHDHIFVRSADADGAMVVLEKMR
jgi:uncharacterized protein